MRKIYFLLLTVLFAAISNAQNVTVAGSGGAANGSYATLKLAFDALNLVTTQAGNNIIVSVTGNTTEVASAVLNQPSVSSWTSLTISPSGGAARTITGAITGHLIDLNGADNVTMNGLNTGGNSLTISNTATGASSAIRLIADASTNTIQNCTIQGSASTASNGVIFFSTGTTTGNDGNNINNCTITGAGANLPLNGIFSLGTSAAIDNSGNTINANNIADIFSATALYSGISLTTGNSTWTITGNRIYQTAARAITTANTENGINVGSGGGYTISDNVIGYASAAATGIMTMTSTVALRYIGINCAFTAGAAVSSLQNNIIASISMTTSSGATTVNGILCGINVTAGNANIGTVIGNTIGATSGTGSLTATATTTGGLLVGINSSSTGTMSIQNNILGSFSCSGTTAAVAGSITGINVSGVSASITISGNTIGNTTVDNMRGGTLGLTTGNSLVAGINAPSTSTIANYSNNTIRNLASYGTGTTGFVRGIQTAASGTTTSCTISGNTVTNLTSDNANVSFGSGQLAAVGIYFAAGLNAVIDNNTVSNITLLNTTTTGTNAAGISVAAALGTTVSRNKIFDISNASTSVSVTLPGTASGIFVRGHTNGTPLSFINNMISLGDGETTNTCFFGIWSANSNGPVFSHNIYFNSVNISGTATSGAQPSFCFLRGDLSATARTHTVDVRNNIFSNTRSGGTGVHYAIANNFGATVSTTGWGTNASNYNVLNANAANIGWWTTAQTFAGWKTASNSDASSISGAVNYVNTVTGDLHITTPYPSLVDAAGIDIPAVTVDFDGQTRSTLTPVDIGADAGVFSNSPAIIYTPLGNLCVTGPRNLIATITDPDGVPTSGIGLPVLYWKINAGLYAPVTATSLGADQYQFTFGGGAVIGDQVSYYIAAQDNLGNVGTSPLSGASGFTPNPPAAATPPTTPSSYLITPTLSGTYTVGVGGNFTTLTAAVNAYNTYCIGGPIIFSLTDATYPTETFPIIVNQNAAASAINTLTIKPAASTTSTITGSLASGAMIRILGNYVTIDGSNNGSSSRNLTINNTSVTTPSVLLFGSTGTTPIINSGLKNSIIINGAQTATAVVVSDGAALGTAGYFNNITIQNNSIQRAYIGVYSIAVVAAGNGSGLLITGNDLNTTGTNSLRLVGLYVQGVDGGTFSNNNIGNMANTLDAANLSGIWFATGTVNCTISGNTISGISGTTTAPRGIAISNAVAASGTTITNNTITGLTSSTTQVTAGVYVFSTTGGVTVQNNKIRDIKNTSATSTAAYGIQLASTTIGANIAIVNNFVSEVASFGSATSTSNGNGIVVSAGSGYSIYYNTVHMNAEQTFVTGIPAAINITSGVVTAGAIDLRNNIFTNSQTIGANRYAIYSGAANTVFAAIDFNDYYTTGPNLGFIGIDRANLAAIQAGFGSNINSQNILPVFVTAADLHLAPGFNPTLNNLGTTIAGITTDIDADIRNGATPDMGADEFSTCSPAATASASSNSPLCEGGTLNLTGTTNGTTFSWTGPNNFSSSLQNPGIPAVTSAAAGVYTFIASLAGCPSLGATTTVVVNPAPTFTLSATPSTICAGSNSQLQATITGLPTSIYSIAGLTGQTYSTLSGGGITIINTNAQLTPTMGGATQDDGGIVVTIPFTFTYNGNTFTQMSMCTNGWLGAGNQGTIDAVSMRTPANLFVSTIPNNTIAAWFKDMGANFPLGTGSMRHGLIGADVYAFQWDNAVGSGFSDGATILISFQINIHGPASATPGRIDVIYGPTVGATAFAASMGIEDAVGGTNHYINSLTGNSTSTITSTVWPGNGNGYRFDLVPYTYSWTPSTFLSATNIANPLASAVANTITYTATVTNNTTSCAASGNVTVTVTPNTTITLTSAAGTDNQTVCFNTPIVPITYAIGGSGTGGSVSGLPAGVTGTFASGVITISGTPSVIGTFNYSVTTTGPCVNPTANGTIRVNDVTGGTVAADQTICSGGDPAAFTQTVSSTGSGALTFQWQSSTTDCASGFSDIAGATATSYDAPAGLLVTTYYRRVTTSTLNSVACTANSNCITVTVNDVTGGTVAADQTICSGGDPAAFTQTSASTGSGTLTYQWESSTTDCTTGFSNIGGATGSTYDAPAGLLVTTHYRRVTTSTLNSVACTANSNCVTVFVNDVTGGTVAADQTVCSGGDPAAFTQTVASTGSGTLSYQWQSNTTSCTAPFTDIAGATGATYDAPSGITVTTYYRRVTTSTLNNVSCTANSNCITVTVNDVTGGQITSGTRGIDQSICSGGDPTLIYTYTPSSGSGTLTYQWQSSTISCAAGFSDIPGATSDSYDPPAGLTVTTYFRRVTTSTLNSVACTDNSNCVTVFVIPGPDATATPSSQTACSGNDFPITTIVLTSSSQGTTFNWTRDNNLTVTGMPASGSGDISGYLDNTTNAPITVTFTITPTNGGCPGTPITATVLVNPTPDVVATPSSQIICSGATITTIALTGAVSGTTFNWTRDNNGIVTGIAASGSGDISGALTSTIGGPVTVTFTITPTINGCEGYPVDATVTVNPSPQIFGSVVQPTTCVSADGAIFLGMEGPFTFFWTTVGGSGIVQGQQSQTGLTVGQYTVVVTNTITGCQATAVYNLTGPGNCAFCPAIGSVTTNPSPAACPNDAVVLTASGLTDMGVTYGITFLYSLSPLADPYTGGTVIGTVANGSLTGGGTTATLNTSFPVSGNYFIYAILSPVPTDPQCRPSASVSLVVNPNANAGTVSGTSPLCAGAATTYTSSGDPGGTWSSSAPGVATVNPVTGLVTAISAGTTTITYTVTDCRGLASASKILTVFPVPTAIATPSSQTICSGSGIAAIVITGNMQSLVVYNWTRDNTGTVTGIASSGQGDISGNLYNTTNAPITVTFTITATANGCPGIPITATVLVNPIPDAIATPASQTICSGNAITTIALTGAVSGTIFNWTRNNIIDITGIAASGSGDISGSLTNTTSIPQTVTFTITPTANGCLGAPITATVLVNPTPNAVATPASQTICSGSTITTMVLTGAVTGTTFNWTRDNTGTVTGIAGTGSGNISGALTNTTNAPVTVTFTITPTANGCPGPSITATVVVNPIPNAVATPASQTICSGNAITTIVNSGNVAGTVYNWTRNNNGTILGIAASGSGNISGSLTNTTTAPVTVTFTIIPSYTNGGVTCTGTPITATVLVNPTPDAVVTPVNQTICSAATITPIVSTGAVSGTTFNWTRDNTATVTGIAGSGSGNISGALTNTTNAPVAVTFTITPIANGCTGASVTAVVLVNPTPNAVATPASQTICSGATITTIVLTGNVAGTVYTWSRDNVFTVTGIANGGTGNISGALTNTTNAPITVTFTITPVYENGGITCTGTPITATVLVNPTPNAVATPVSQTICSESNIIPIVLSGAVSGTTFNWTRNNIGTVTGIAASGSGNISGQLINTTNAPITVTFTITPTANGCPGSPITATVLVNPNPNAVATPQTQTICSGNAITPIILSGNVAGTTYSWIRDNTTTVAGIPGFGSGNISGSLTNNTNAQINVTFIITPTANGCQGPSINAIVVVNPAPTITCPSNIVVNAAAGTCGAVVNYPPATATGTPAPTITYSIPSGSTFNVGVTTVTATATNACGTVSCTFTITVLDVRVPVITTLPVNRAVCVGGSTSFSVVATNAASYQWQTGNANNQWGNIPGATSSTFAVNNAPLSLNGAIYRVAVTGPCGTVVFSNPVTLTVNPLPLIKLSSNTTAELVPGRTVIINTTATPAGGTFAWLFNGAPITATGPTLGPLNVDNIGRYNVIYTDLNGCVNTSSDFLVTGEYSITFWVYPNPTTSGRFQVRFNNHNGEVAKVKVYDPLGQLVYQQRVTTGPTTYARIDVDLSNAANGIYTVELLNGSDLRVGAKQLSIFR